MGGRAWRTHTMIIVVLQLLCFIPTMVYSSFPSDGARDHQVMGFRVNMKHIDSQEISLLKRSQSAVERSKKRAGCISATLGQKQIEKHGNAKGYGSPVHVGNGEFLIEIGYGSPAIKSEGVLDTGSDIIWTQCFPCRKCYRQSVPLFDPKKSSTFSKLGCKDFFCTSALGPGQPGCNKKSGNCEFANAYSDGSKTRGYLVKDTLTLGNGSTISHAGFGCGIENNVAPTFQGKLTGIVGMGRGPLSLASQVGAYLGKKRFSYCFLSYDKYFGGPPKTSPLFFGQLADLIDKSPVQTMKFVKNELLPPFYYIPLTGIAVGGKGVKIPARIFNVKEDGSGGVIIDSGTSLIQLAEGAYTPLADAIRAGINLRPVDGSSVGLDLCYAVKAGSALPRVPSLTFVFEGRLKYKFPLENYFRQASDDLFCLAIIPLPPDSTSASVFGNIAQQNFHILYDDDSSTLSFQSVACDSL
ncbi:hypothetical protein SUGI_1037160 [Cryptomeria japonica]|uniref:aspartic proteinase nepenthesin-1 n=1 Tax=Cryptomeria japonica TaxID=3369 RepID=UPI0024147B1E|nr:aspartic proteinase nepenthesin-1 [Cryptomeria japonica]GLJ49161.1 hypothetical protein SUGI_1037160 [Cryptomeria japonica]